MTMRFDRKTTESRVLIALLLGLFVFGLVAATLHHHDHDHADGDRHQNCPVCIVGWVVVLIAFIWLRWGLVPRPPKVSIEGEQGVAAPIDLLIASPPRGPPSFC